jgi:hypothetical protein
VIHPDATKGSDPKPAFPLAVVLWEDSYNGDHHWFRASEVPAEIVGHHLMTVGWLVRQSADRVTLVMSVGVTGDDPELCDTFTIPRGCLRAMSILALPAEMVAQVPDAG